MANLKRYDIDEKFDFHGNSETVVGSANGDWVKFDDIKELLNSSDNSERDDICPLCKKKCYPSKYYCADCNNEFIP